MNIVHGKKNLISIPWRIDENIINQHEKTCLNSNLLNPTSSCLTTLIVISSCNDWMQCKRMHFFLSNHSTSARCDFRKSNSPLETFPIAPCCWWFSANKNFVFASSKSSASRFLISKDTLKLRIQTCLAHSRKWSESP